MMRTQPIAVGSILCLVTLAAGGEPATKPAGAVSFSARPAVTRDGDKLKIAFAVSAPTDVEVAVLSADGKVVNHLAAGVLGGEKPPPAPLKAGLAQELIWDGKDDKGKPVTGPSKVRVRAGMKPEFDGLLLHNPHSTSGVHALAAGPGGQIYAFHKQATANGNMGGHDIKIYDHEGKHVRVLKPFAADIAPERIKATGAFRDAEGRVVPRIHNWETLNFCPDPSRARGRSMPDSANPAAVDSRGRVYWIAEGGKAGPVLMALDADGGAAYEDFIGPGVLPQAEGVSIDNVCLAASGDDRFVYVSGLKKGKWNGKGQDTRPAVPCVFRVDVATRVGEAFLGKPDQAGKEGALLTEPRGVAAAKELVYVADPGADRVAVFSEKDGSFVGQVAVPKPGTIGVDPESGAIYVCSMSEKPPMLIKFDGYKNAKELYRCALPKSTGKQNYRIAVGTGAKPAGGEQGRTVRIWMPEVHYGPGFFCIEDTGEKFEFRDDPRPKGPSASGPRDLTVDRIRGELYVKASGERWYRIDEKDTNDIKRIDPGRNSGMMMGAYATQLVTCDDGSLVTLSYAHGLRRWTRDFKPLNWEGKGDNKGSWGGIMTFTQNYLAVRGDELFAIPRQFYRLKDKKDATSRFTSLNVFGMDEKEKRTAVWQATIGTIPRVDRHGNIYLASMIRPVGRTWPEFFDDKLAPAPDKLHFSSAYWYSYMYGGIVKFPPSGGAIWFKEDEIPDTAIGKPPAELLAKPKIDFSYNFYWNTKLSGKLQGAEWFRFGFAPYSETYPIGTPSCMCEGAGFDVDDWGRVFYPNLGQFRVEMIDNNNNFIGTFGAYGNEDSLGAGKAAEGSPRENRSKAGHPDIPLAWPTYVAVSDTHAYVNDTLGRRVVRVKLGWQAEETLEAR